MVLSVIGFILFLICVRIFIALNPFSKLIQQIQNTNNKRERRKDKVEEKELETIAPMIAQPTAPVYPKFTNNETQKSLNQSPEHSHNHCTYVVGKGLVWEDLCPCDSN